MSIQRHLDVMNVGWMLIVLIETLLTEDFDFNSMSFERYGRQMDVETTLFAYKTFLT